MPSGRGVRLPAGDVLGKRGGFWYVAVDGNRPVVLKVGGGTTRTLWHHRYDESATSYRMFPGSDLVVEDNFTRAGTSYVRVIDTRGRSVDLESWDDSAFVVDLVDRTALVSAYSPESDSYQLQRWELGSEPVPLGLTSSWADLARDLVFVGDHLVGPTTLSAPGTPAWTAAFYPWAVSPDGQWVAGLAGGRRHKLEVRSLADGHVVVTGVRLAHGDPAIAWEPDGDVLAAVAGKRGRAILRCTVAGACEQATGWLDRREALAFPSL